MKIFHLFLFFIIFLGDLSAVGTLFLVAGPSGAGKTTLVSRLIEDHNLHDKLSMYVIFTSRPMRKGEIEGVDYHFISSEEFENLVEQGKIFYYVEFDKYRYGYPIELIKDLSNGQSLIMIVGTRDAAENFQKLLPHTILIWVDVSDSQMLKHRLEFRYRGNPELVKRRYDIAVNQRNDEYLNNIFHHHILNDDGQCDEAFAKFRQIIFDSLVP